MGADSRGRVKAASAAGGGRTALVLAAIALLVVGALGGYLLGRSAGDDAPPIDQSVTEPLQEPSASDAGDASPSGAAPAGSALTTITTPPENTLAMIDADKLSADARYSVTFSPYGYGPPQGGDTLVISIAVATPENEGAAALDFDGRNLLALVEPGTGQVTMGGTYTATLTFRPDGGLLLPLLSEITAAD